jgi:hypothetical protein
MEFKEENVMKSKRTYVRGGGRRFCRCLAEKALLLSPLIASLLLTGCAGASPDRAQRMQRGYVYYLDGAGGGGVTNWSGGVRQGLHSAGYDGAGEMFSWETGLGVLADQTASNDYKRGKARQLAQKMAEYRRQYPQTPITTIGLSAGTVLAVFTLEELPASVMVENVFLLSGSLSATYDLTRALRHVRGAVYVTTSQKDVVLGGLLPLAGTADRGADTTATIGVEGPYVPRGGSTEAQQLYSSKLRVVPWRPEFARYGDAGGHTDTVAAAFIERYLAPLVETTSGVQFAAAATNEAELVENPAYKRWVRMPVGTWTVFEGQQTVAGVTRPCRVKTTLVKKSPTLIVLRREQLAAPSDTEASLFDQVLHESAQIRPEDQPMTHPARQTRVLPNAEISVGSSVLDCAVELVSASGEFHDWGRDPQLTLYTQETVPGGIVRIDVKTSFGDKVVDFKGKLAEFHIPTE